MATQYTTTVQVRGGGKSAEDAAVALRSVLTGTDRPVRLDGDDVLVDVDVSAADTSEAAIQALDVVREALQRAGLPVATATALDTRASS